MGLLHPCVDMFQKNATFLKPRALKALFRPNFLKVVATNDDDYPIIYRVLTIPGGAGFLPSTVSHQLLKVPKNPWGASKVLLVADTNQPRTNFEIMQDLNPSARCLEDIINKKSKITGPQKT